MIAKRICAGLAAVALVFTSTSMPIYSSVRTISTVYAVSTEFSGVGDGTEANPYQITSASELMEIENNPSSYYVLNNDIDLSGYNDGLWNGICDENNPFTGTFDGQNFTIKNIEFSDFNHGLFNATKSACIQNININSSNITINHNSSSELTNYYFGIIIGIDLSGDEDDSSIISNCNVNLNLEISNLENKRNINYYVGGLVGMSLSEKLGIYNCSFNGDISYYSLANKNSTTHYVGGCVGYGKNTLICNNFTYNGNISSNVSAYANTNNVGGIAGKLEEIISDGCVIYGDINCTVNRDGEDRVDDWAYRNTGGLVGSTGNYSVSNAEVVGSIYSNCDYGSDNVGGIFGACYSGDIISCTYKGDIKSYAQRTGAVGNVGGICGSAEKVNILNCNTENTIYNCGYTYGAEIHSGGMVGKAHTCNVENYYIKTNITPDAFDGANCPSYSGGVIGYARNVYLEETPIDVTLNNSSKGIHNYNDEELNNDYVGYAYNYYNISETLNSSAKITGSTVTTVVGKKTTLCFTYTEKNPLNIDDELSNLTYSYDWSALAVENLTYIKSSDNKTALVTADVTASKYGSYEIDFSVYDVYTEVEPIIVTSEPELIISGSTAGNAYNNYSNLNVKFNKSRYSQTKEVKLTVSIDMSDKDYLESFLKSIEIEREDTTDLVTGRSEYSSSYTISDDGKSAEYILTVTTQDLDIKDYLVIKTPAQSKKICISRESTVQGTKDDYTAADDYIIGEVEKYCSDDGDISFLNEVNSGNYTYEARQEMLLNYFSNYGLNSEKEGIQYISEATAYRRNYNYLINNNNFCASIYNQEIEDDIVKKTTLINAGLIFNNELTEPFNFSPDLINHSPTAKKYKEMLKSFIGASTQSVESLSVADKGGKYLSKALKIYNTADDYQLNQLMDEILECDDSKELEKLQTKFAKYIADAAKKGDGSLKSPAISEALGYATSTISFASATADDVMALINLEDEIELYQKNIYLLQTIADSELSSYDMKLAAQSLLDDIENGYKKLTDDILVNIFEYSKDTMETVVDFDAWKSVFGESLGGDISGALGTYKLGVFVSNLIIDTGDFVKQTSYTKGYAELADLFQNILQNDKWEFNRNMSKENAWKFFEDYTILWELRYQGESQYLKASKIKVLFWDNIPINNYGNKEQVVKDIQQILENSRFFVSSSISVPDSVQYITKAVICCPVDVYVYASDGTLLAKLEDGVESDTINEYGRFAVVYNPCTDEYDKVIAKSTDDELNIKMVSIDDGLVNYNLIYKDSDGNIQSLSFDNKDIYKGDIISVNTNDDKYYVDRNGDGKIDETVLLTKNNNEYIKVDGISVTSKSITLHVGETAVINANVTPENASYKLLNWNSSDDSIVEVKNGKIIANSIGSAEITSTATDNQSVTSEVKVTVIESDHDWSDWSVTKSATESDEGLETRTCKNDSSHIETRSIPKLTHTHKLIKVDAIEATCTEKGNIEYWTCSDCEKLFSDETAMTEINVEDTVITEHGHKYGEWTVTIPATCETDGEELQVCSYDTNHKESRLISAIDHDWNEGVVTKEATSTEDGELTYTCQNDSNHVKTEIIPATEKNDDNSSSDTDVPTNDESSNSSSSNSDSSSAKDSSSNNNSSDSNSSNNSSSSSSNSTGNDKGNGTAQGNNSINTSDSTNPNTGDIGAAKFLSFSALMLGIVTVLKKKKQ